MAEESGGVGSGKRRWSELFGRKTEAQLHGHVPLTIEQASRTQVHYIYEEEVHQLEEEITAGLSLDARKVISGQIKDGRVDPKRLVRVRSPLLISEPIQDEPVPVRGLGILTSEVPVGNMPDEITNCQMTVVEGVPDYGKDGGYKDKESKVNGTKMMMVRVGGAWVRPSEVRGKNADMVAMIEVQKKKMDAPRVAVWATEQAAKQYVKQE